jgi:hypothetical protein
MEVHLNTERATGKTYLIQRRLKSFMPCLYNIKDSYLMYLLSEIMSGLVS